MFDMRPRGVSDAKYIRLVFGKVKTNPVFDLEEGLKTLRNDFNRGACARGIVYDYDTGYAFSICKEDVDKDFTNALLDDYLEVD